MKFIAALLSMLVLVSCERLTPEMPDSSKEMESVSLKIPEVSPDNAFGIIWQSTYPEEYEELLREVEIMREQFRNPQKDPFAAFPWNLFDVPDSELTPSSFCPTADWRWGLLWQAFRELGYPISRPHDSQIEGISSVSMSNTTGIVKIYHLPEAIAAFRSRFPEFEPVPQQ